MPNIYDRHNLNPFLVQPNLALRDRELNEPGTIVERVEEEQEPVLDIKECVQARAVVAQRGSNHGGGRSCWAATSSSLIVAHVASTSSERAWKRRGRTSFVVLEPDEEEKTNAICCALAAAEKGEEESTRPARWCAATREEEGKEEPAPPFALVLRRWGRGGRGGFCALNLDDQVMPASTGTGRSRNTDDPERHRRLQMAELLRDGWNQVHHAAPSLADEQARWAGGQPLLIRGASTITMWWMPFGSS